MDRAAQDVAVRSSSKALIVDDEATNRLLLKSILSKSGFEVCEAENGAVAVEVFSSARPDIIFMDAMMPVMDGYEAATAIKAAAGDDFVPIIFLTALTDKESLARCIDAGGDDFLTKPISGTLLKAKIRALERIRDLQREVRALYDQMRRDEEIAETVFEKIVSSRNVSIAGPRYHVSPAGVFSGDMYLSEISPSGDLNILLADVTGHGLSAALAAMPAADTFRALTRKGFAPEQIVAQINDKLCQSLPGGMFMALQFVSINGESGRIAFSNCGMPDALVVDGESRRIKQYLKSTSLPLGISKNFDAHSAVQYIPHSAGDHILLATDGVVEAQNPAGDYFGDERYEAAILQSRGQAYALDGVLEQLSAFCLTAKQADDISMVDIPLTPELLSNVVAQLDLVHEEKPVPDKVVAVGDHEDVFEIAMTLQGAMLAKADPVPMLLGQINEVMDLKEHKNVLYTILTELYNNALDHGILKLDSALKQGAEGFAEYYTRREDLLSTLQEGQVKLIINVAHSAGAGAVRIHLQDSGEGFDYQGGGGDASDGELLSRRGVTLVQELCEFVNYQGCGNVVEALYRWSESGDE